MYFSNVASTYSHLSNPVYYGMNYNSYSPMDVFSAYKPAYLQPINFLNNAWDGNNSYLNSIYSGITNSNNLYLNSFSNPSIFNSTITNSRNDNLFGFLNKPTIKRDNYLFINGGNSSSTYTSGTAYKGKTFDNTDNAKSTATWENFKKTYKVRTSTINGSKVYVCNWSSFSKSQPEWLGLQKHMIEAAEELGLTLVYSDMDRSVSASNAARKKKGNIVAAGGKSPHNYGTACDICLFKDGKQVSTKSAQFREFANLVKQKSNNQIAWGGDWNKKNEEHHFELRNWKKYQKDEYKIV